MILRKSFLILVILGVGFFTVQEKAEANGGWHFWMADEASIASKEEFGWDEQPYSYFFVSKDFFTAVPEHLDIKWQWFYGDEQQYEEHYFYFPWNESTDEEGNFRIWESPQNWLSIRELGDWSAKVVWKAKIGEEWTGYRYKSFDFTVTPEPVSGILFLAGGASLTAARLRRRDWFRVE